MEDKREFKLKQNELEKYDFRTILMMDMFVIYRNAAFTLDELVIYVLDKFRNLCIGNMDLNGRRDN